MAETEEKGVTTETTYLFALRNAAGEWRIEQGSISFVEGHFHKITFAGFETRSGGGDLGLTVTFHTVGAYPDGKAAVVKYTVINGRLQSTEPVAALPIAALRSSGIKLELK